MVCNDDAVVLAPFPDKRFNLFDVNRIYLCKWFIQNEERRIAQDRFLTETDHHAIDYKFVSIH